MCKGVKAEPTFKIHFPVSFSNEPSALKIATWEIGSRSGSIFKNELDRSVVPGKHDARRGRVGNSDGTAVLQEGIRKYYEPIKEQ